MRKEKDKDILKVLEKYESMLDFENLTDENIDETFINLSKDLETLSNESVDLLKNEHLIDFFIENNFSISDVKFNQDSSITLYNRSQNDIYIEGSEKVKIYTGYTTKLPKNTILTLKSVDGVLTPIDYIIDKDNKLYITIFTYGVDYIINPNMSICKIYLTPILSKEYINIKS